MSLPPNSLSGQETPALPMVWRRLRNGVLVVITLGLAIVLAWGGQWGQPTLESLAAAAVPLDEAVRNDRPTLVEFYANWCSSCRAMVPDLAKLEARYGDRLNVVMLNVDNSNWLPEILRYNVDGIPHFVFLNRQGQPVGQAIGKQPLDQLQGAIEALLADHSLDQGLAPGQTSAYPSPQSAS